MVELKRWSEIKLKADSVKTSYFPSSQDTLKVVRYYKESDCDLVEQYYSNGQIQSRCCYKNKYYRTDTCAEWYKSGKIQSLDFYIDDRPRGGKTWYEDGKIECEDIINDTLAISKCYYPNGLIKSEDSLDSESYVSGYKRKWHPNGKLDYNMVIGRGIQKLEIFYPNGRHAGIGKYIDNPLYLIGDQFEYYDNGQMLMEEHYKETTNWREARYRIGKWKYWNREGKLIKIEFYKNNELVKTKDFLTEKTKE